MCRGEYFADIVHDRRSKPPLFHCIVQREGSPEILYWGQYFSLEEAERAAQAQLQEIASRSAKSAG